MKLLTLLIALGILYFTVYYYATTIDIYTIDTKHSGPTVLMIGGTHGNEPAGTVWIEQFLENPPLIKYGKIIMIPRLNKIGLLLNRRHIYHNLLNNDLNRNYPIKDGEEGKDPINKQVVELVKNADFIIDFHEGWGFNRIDHKSMASGLYPSNTKKSIMIANELLISINKTIKDPKKHFIINYVENLDQTLKTLLNHACYKKKDYIQIETSGQNNIQPLQLRVEQNKFITMFILNKLGMI
jgi:hypothetical protein